MNEKEATWLIVLLSLAAWVWAGGGLLLPGARGAKPFGGTCAGGYWQVVAQPLGCFAWAGVWRLIKTPAVAGVVGGLVLYMYFFAALHIKMPAISRRASS